MKEKLKKLLEEISVEENKASEINKTIWNLTEKIVSSVVKIINDEKLLENTEWELGYSTSNLRSKGGIPSIADLIKEYNIWITDFEVESGVTLENASSPKKDEFQLHFTDPKQMVSFVQKRKLIVDTAAIASKLHELKREVAALETVCHIFNIKTK